MMKLSLFLSLLLLSPAAPAQGLDASLDCRPTGEDFVYDCTIRLTRDGRPLSGARLSVGADMPSMPGAHDMKPVRAKPGAAPGDYEARLDLEMQGEWELKLRVSGPVRGRLVKRMRFG